MVLINPIVETSGKDIEWREACLSLPGVSGKVKRKENCSVVFLDENGVTKKLEAGWPLSGVLQHEIDHLEGKLFVDYLSPLKRQIIRKKMKKK